MKPIDDSGFAKFLLALLPLPGFPTAPAHVAVTSYPQR
jgi:hypothetical protein